MRSPRIATTPKWNQARARFGQAQAFFLLEGKEPHEFLVAHATSEKKGAHCIMFIRRKSLQQVFPARWNPSFRVGPCKDPLLEFHNGLAWLAILPADANADVEVVAADAAELET